MDRVLVPIPLNPGGIKRQDDEYVRQGTCCVLMAFEPLGSWLNMAEIELAALARQCLDRRIGDIDTFKEVAIWTDERNHARKTVQWKFTKTEARQTLKRKYPMLQD